MEKKYEVWIGEKNTGYMVSYTGDIYIDSLIEQVEHLRTKFEGRLWLKLVSDVSTSDYSEAELRSWGGPGY
jgi:hypothetical protein